MNQQALQPDLRPFYLLLVGVGCIVAHLAAEFAAMGSDAESIVFSARHWYLGLTALTCIVTLAVSGRALYMRSSGGRDLKRLLHLGLDTLPFGGKGIRYYAVTAALQLALGLLTQAGEGCPFCSHDIAAGVLGALLTVVLFGFATHAAARRLPTAVAALVRLLPAPVEAASVFLVRSERTAADARVAVWSPQLYNRPPPQLRFHNASF
jgi:hypothetical protein